jgi:hypothetical protein
MKVWAIGGGTGSTYYCDGGGGRNGVEGAVAVYTFSVTGGEIVDYTIGIGGPVTCDGGSGRNGGDTTVTHGAFSVTGGGSLDTSAPYNLSEINGTCTNATTCGLAGNDVDGLNNAVMLAGGSITGRGIGGNIYATSPGGAGALVLYFT